MQRGVGIPALRSADRPKGKQYVIRRRFLGSNSHAWYPRRQNISLLGEFRDASFAV